MRTGEPAGELAVLDALNGGVVVLDRDTRILYWNAWMVLAAERAAAEVRGKTLAEVFPALDTRRLQSAVRTAFDANASTVISHTLNTAPFPLQTRSGRVLLHDITISPIGSGADGACLLFVTDVTMAHHREQYLR